MIVLDKDYQVKYLVLVLGSQKLSRVTADKKNLFWALVSTIVDLHVKFAEHRTISDLLAFVSSQVGPQQKC